MVLAMSRPSRHPKTGIFWLRKRVPSDLVARVGRAIEYFSLQTREPADARQRHAQAVARLEAHWAELRRGEATKGPAAATDASSPPRRLSEREAGERAGWMYAHWLGLHRENPSQQRFWPTDLYRHLWRSPGGRIEHRQDGCAAARAVLGFAHAEKVAELEAWCQDQAETVLFLHNVEADETSVLRVAKAIAAQVQRASLTLAALARGEPDIGPATAHSGTPVAKPAQAIGLIELGPCCANRCDPRLTLDTLTPNRAAARWKEAPSATAATTRSRRSTDNREGIAGSFTRQRSSHPPVATPPGTAPAGCCRSPDLVVTEIVFVVGTVIA